MREPGFFPWAPGHTASHTRCPLLSRCPEVTPPRLGDARDIKTGPEGPVTAAMAQFQSQRHLPIATHLYKLFFSLKFLAGVAIFCNSGKAGRLQVHDLPGLYQNKTLSQKLKQKFIKA